MYAPNFNEAGTQLNTGKSELSDFRRILELMEKVNEQAQANLSDCYDIVRAVKPMEVSAIPDTLKAKPIDCAVDAFFGALFKIQDTNTEIARQLGHLRNTIL